MHPLNFSNWHPLLDFSWLDISTWNNKMPPEPGEDGFIGPPTFKQSVMNGGHSTWMLVLIPMGYLIYKKYC